MKIKRGYVWLLIGIAISMILLSYAYKSTRTEHQIFEDPCLDTYNVCEVACFENERYAYQACVKKCQLPFRDCSAALNQN